MEFMFLLLLIAIIVIFFAAFKRPMYEGVLIAFLVVAVISGNGLSIGTYLWSAINNYLLYTVVAFLAFSIVVEKTGLINDFINVIISLVGRFSGGAGYVALVASSAFGALSGTGPGNAAAVGVIAIPAMKKTGFSPELAATVEMAASALGPVIPPSGTVVVTFAMLEALYPGCCSFSQYWIFMWGISLIFIGQRFITLFILIKKYHVRPIPKEDRLPMRVALKNGWKVLLLPIIVFLPFLMDALYSDTLIAARIGAEGASSFTSTLLVLVPCLAIAYVMLVHRSNGNVVSLKTFYQLFEDAIPSMAPVTFLIICGFSIGALFNDIELGNAIIAVTKSVQIPLWFVIVVLPLILLVLGMFLEVMTIIMIATTPVLLIGASVGINPILMAGMLNVMAVAMGHMTPPFALTFYVSMGLANSDFWKTTKLAVIWCLGQFIVQVLVLLGWIPVPGLVPFTP